MNRSELISAVADETRLAKKDIDKVILAACQIIKEEVAKGSKVQLISFGTFEGHERKARQARNPRSKAVVDIPASVVPTFKAAKAFKDMVNQKEEEL